MLFMSVDFHSTSNPPQVIQVQPIESIAIDSKKLEKQINKLKAEKAAKKAAVFGLQP